MAKLSENFTLAELIRSDTAARNNIENVPSFKEEQALRHLTKTILQPVRDEFGRIRVTSGYRCKELNYLIGGSVSSQHSKGEAADFESSEPEPVSNYDICVFIANNLQFDQLILEFYDPKIPDSGWVHCSTFVETETQKLRGEMLIAKKVNNKTVYEEVNFKTIKPLEYSLTSLPESLTWPNSNNDFKVPDGS